MWVTGGLWPPCPVGISGWLWAASSHPPSGPSHWPLFLAVIDPPPAPGFVLDGGERTKPAREGEALSAKPHHGVARGDL